MSAGRRDLLAILTSDAQGNFVGLRVTMADKPNLTGLAGFPCPKLKA